jgi:pimeloyl-ACP methyl ester carboxylesterase
MLKGLSTIWRTAVVGLIWLLSKPSCAVTYDSIDLFSPDKSLIRPCDKVVQDEIDINLKTTLKAQFTSCFSSESKPKGIIVYVNGGPGTPPSRPPSYLESYFMLAGYDVVIPIYFGTGARTVLPGAAIRPEDCEKYDDATPAIEDVKQTLRWARKRYGKVILSGASAGGYIAAASCRNRCADGLLMIVPIIATPNQLWEEIVKDNPKIIPVESFKPYVKDGIQYDIRNLELPAIQQYRRAVELYFYGTKRRHTSLADLLKRSSKAVPKLIIAGSADDRVGIKHLPEVLAIAPQVNMDVLTFKEMSHNLGDEILLNMFAFLDLPNKKGAIPHPAGKCFSAKLDLASPCPP